MFCKYCGKEIDDTAKFCGNCGGNLSLMKVEEKQEKADDKELERYMRMLRPKDGNRHVLVVYIYKFMFKDEEKEVSIKLNKIIEEMQKKQYEILDIKLSLPNVNQYTTLIIYK